MPDRPDIFAITRARLAAVDAFAKKHDGAPFQVDLGGRRSVLVHRDPESKRWRTTSLDARGPVGHTFFPTYREAVKSVVMDHRGDLARAQIGPKSNPARWELSAWPWGGKRPNPPRTIALVPRWTWLAKGANWNPAVRSQVRGQTGVYAIRDRRTKTVLYVGESHAFPVRDKKRMWKTITRHFQDTSGKFAPLGEWTHARPELCEISVWTIPPGEPARALGLEARAQRRFRPSGILREPAPF